MTTSQPPWLLRQFARLDGLKIPGWVWVVALWAAIVIPTISLRGTHYEEGTVIGLARGALEDGHWLAPTLYGQRFVERPVLLSWIIAALGWPLGHIPIWLARLPHLLFLLSGGLMIYALVRAHAGKAAAFFGAMCWFACPMVAQKFITTEPDVTLSVLMFAAFFIWWRGLTAGSQTIWRWCAIVLALTAAGLTKGPQPLAYFALGAGSYLLIKRQWRDIAPLVIANIATAAIVGFWYWAVATPQDTGLWLRHSRLSDAMALTTWLKDHLDFLGSLVFEWLPGSLLIIPVAILLMRSARNREHDLALAAFLYVVVCTMVLLIWPGGVATRYAMPANLSLAVLCGLMFETWRTSHPRLIATCATIAAAISVYLLVLGWVAMPLAPDLFNRTRIAAQSIASVRKIVPGPLLVSSSTLSLNILAYAAHPIRIVSLSDLLNVKQPTLAALSPQEVEAISREKPSLRVIPHADINDSTMSRVVEIRPN